MKHLREVLHPQRRRLRPLPAAFLNDHHPHKGKHKQKQLKRNRHDRVRSHLLALVPQPRPRPPQRQPRHHVLHVLQAEVRQAVPLRTPQRRDGREVLGVEVALPVGALRHAQVRRQLPHHKVHAQAGAHHHKQAERRTRTRRPGHRRVGRVARPLPQHHPHRVVQHRLRRLRRVGRVQVPPRLRVVPVRRALHAPAAARAEVREERRRVRRLCGVPCAAAAQRRVVAVEKEEGSGERAERARAAVREAEQHSVEGGEEREDEGGELGRRLRLVELAGLGGARTVDAGEDAAADLDDGHPALHRHPLRLRDRRRRRRR
eukprot:Rhum_TRINITY_DN14774_c1_g1::Rhum_TRINITY_DN14774_c1_g1_i1::g.116245::m.116245